MTKEEFKNFLYEARYDKREYKSVLQSYKDLDEEFLQTLSAGAMDYSKDKVQSSSSPDQAMAIAIDRLNEKREKLTKRLAELDENLKRIERTIDLLNEFSSDGLTHEILRLFFLEDQKMDTIALRINFTERWCWQHWREGIDTLYELYEKLQEEVKR